MTSCNFGQFLTPIITRFITKTLVLSSQNPWPQTPLDLDVVLGRPLTNCVEVLHDLPTSEKGVVKSELAIDSFVLVLESPIRIPRVSAAHSVQACLVGEPLGPAFDARVPVSEIGLKENAERHQEQRGNTILLCHRRIEKTFQLVNFSSQLALKKWIEKMSCASFAIPRRCQ